MFGLEVLFIGRVEQQVFQSGAVEDDNLFGRVVDDAALFQTVECRKEYRPLYPEEGIEVFLLADDVDVARFLLRKAQHPECQPFFQVVRREGGEAFESLLRASRQNVEQVDEEYRFFLQHLYDRTLLDLHDSYGAFGIQVGREIGIAAEQMFGGYDIRRLYFFGNFHLLVLRNQFRPDFARNEKFQMITFFTTCDDFLAIGIFEEMEFHFLDQLRYFIPAYSLENREL